MKTARFGVAIGMIIYYGILPIVSINKKFMPFVITKKALSITHPSKMPHLPNVEIIAAVL